jgi:hypothetical protein
MLKYIMTTANLTTGQVAVKADILRSQAYNMINSSRSSLPAKREHPLGARLAR